MKTPALETVRAIVRQALQEKLGPSQSGRSESSSLQAGGTAFGGAVQIGVEVRVHPSHLAIAAGPEGCEDLDFPVRKPCLIEPHRLCYNSGYCKNLGH